jgi:hypothetical protein
MAVQTLCYTPYSHPSNETLTVPSNIKIPKTLTAFHRHAHKIHGDRYDYSQVNQRHLLRATSRIPLRCKFCRYAWSPTLYQHLIAKWSCPNCSGIAEWDLLRFLERGSMIQESGRSHSASNSANTSPCNSPSR